MEGFYLAIFHFIKALFCELFWVCFLIIIINVGGVKNKTQFTFSHPIVRCWGVELGGVNSSQSAHSTSVLVVTSEIICRGHGIKFVKIIKKQHSTVVEEVRFGGGFNGEPEIFEAITKYLLLLCSKIFRDIFYSTCNVIKQSTRLFETHFLKTKTPAS